MGKHFDIPPAKALGKYFGKYFLSTKAYRTKEIPNPFFFKRKFLLEVGCMHVNAYGMPKQKVGIIIDTFGGAVVDWGMITGPTLREVLHAYQAGKKLRPIIQQYLTILFLPRGLRRRHDLRNGDYQNWQTQNGGRNHNLPIP